MYENVKFYLKVYSIMVIVVIGMKIFLHRKSNAMDLAALVPTLIYLCNL